MASNPQAANEQDAYFARMAPMNLLPAWKVMSTYAPLEPTTPCLPAVWHYREIRPHLLDSTRVIGAKEAERRALLLHNPGLGDSAYGITQTISGDYQIMLPGEIAPAHRHTQTAFRFFIEGENAFTVIDGEKIYMYPGDLIIQPPGLFHHHGHEGEPGSPPAIWFDALDVGMCGMFESTFFHSYSEDEFPVKRPPGANRRQFGANVVPVGHQGSERDRRMFSYPYETTRAALDSLRETEPCDPYYGWKVRYINPQTGDHAMTTMAAHLQFLAKGMTTAPYRATDGVVFIVVEGKGRTVVGSTVLEWEPHDVFVVPSWKWHRHETDTEAVLFSYSDRAAQEKLGLWFEERGNNPT